MATIIRSDVTLKAPTPGTQVLPSLGVSGVTHRWHADTVAVTEGQTVTAIKDSVGNANLTSVTGSIILRSTGGRRYLDFSAATDAQNRIAGAASGDSNEAFTLAGLVYWEPGTGSTFGMLGTSTVTSMQAIGMEPTRNGITAYNGGTGGAVIRAAAPANGWHTVVVTYRKTGDETVSIDGQPAVNGEAHNITPARAIDQFSIAGLPNMKVRVIDYAFINRAASESEHATLHQALRTQIPAA